MKGIIELAEDPSRPLVVHGVQSILHPPARLAAWPDADARHAAGADHARHAGRLCRAGCSPPSPTSRRSTRRTAPRSTDNPLAIAGRIGRSSLSMISSRPADLLDRFALPRSTEEAVAAGHRRRPRPAGGRFVQKAGMSMTASGSVVSSQSRLPGAHARQPLARLQHRQRAVQPLEIVDRLAAGQGRQPQRCRMMFGRCACDAAEDQPGRCRSHVSSSSCCCRPASPHRPAPARRCGGDGSRLLLGCLRGLGLLLGFLARLGLRLPCGLARSLAAAFSSAMRFFSASAASSAAILRPACESMRPMRLVTTTVPSGCIDGGSIGTRSPRARLLRPFRHDLGFLDAEDRRLRRRHVGARSRRWKAASIARSVGLVGASPAPAAWSKAGRRRSARRRRCRRRPG